ncbi:MAG: FAD-dependent monooxygenase [Sphingobacteriales bacterium]|nr:MAG: FAD-dependent monooxygenase [Sphingobacteriales bacterium]
MTGVRAWFYAGGLTLARLLQLQNVDVIVYERDIDKNARVQGAPLDLHENSGLAAIGQAGLLDVFKQNFMPGADREVITNERAEVFYSEHGKPEENFGHEHFRPEIDRGVLRRILLESLQPETVVWDAHFISMEKQNNGWLLHFKNGSTAYADVVVAADGANSKIRPYVTDIKPFYSGITMLEGTVYNASEAIPHVYALLNGGKIMAFGNAKNLLMGQKADGEVGFYASFKADENWAFASGIDYKDNMQVLDWFKYAYPEWDSLWHELFLNNAVPYIPRPIYCMPLDQYWEAQPHVTLLGDAAHLMPPFAGEGVNMAMLDALELCGYLVSGNYPTILEAIAAYETNMRKRASAVAQESLDNGEKMHSPTALQDMLAFFQGV